MVGFISFFSVVHARYCFRKNGRKTHTFVKYIGNGFISCARRWWGTGSIYSRTYLGKGIFLDLLFSGLKCKYGKVHITGHCLVWDQIIDVRVTTVTRWKCAAIGRSRVWLWIVGGGIYTEKSMALKKWIMSVILWNCYITITFIIETIW